MACVTLGGEPPKGEAGDSLARGVVTPPQWCTDNPFTGWTVKRSQACSIASGLYTIYEVKNGIRGAVIGTMNFVLYRYLFTSLEEPLIADQIQVSSTIVTGAAVGTELVKIDYETGDDFLVGYANLPTTTLTPGVFAQGDALSSWDVEASSHAFNQGTWVIAFNSPNVPDIYEIGIESNTAALAAPPIRCDNELPGRTTSGCVFIDSVPNITYNTTSPNVTEFANHVQLAQASGLPGSSASQIPLHRTTVSSTITANRNLACPQSLPRPDGKSCDEYPFASTYEGAYASQVINGSSSPRTFPGCGVTLSGTPSTGAVGYSVCMIDKIQNSAAGSLLNSNLLVPYRIIEGDAYYVNVE